MNYQRKFLTLLLVLLLPAGCLGTSMPRDRVNEQIDVFGVKLFSDVRYGEINGIAAVEEPCLRGYERSFDGLDLTIGYGFDNRIRKITTRNRDNRMLGIKPGMTYEEGRQKILHAGIREHTTPFLFRVNGYSLTLLVDGNNTIFGITLESLD
jgi:hypothetical protein